jgi:Homeodomain-like domain
LRPKLGVALEERLRVALKLRARGELDGAEALRLVVWPPPGPLEEARFVREWPPAMRAEALELYDAGYSFGAIAEELGVVTAPTVKAWLLKAGYRRAGERPSVTLIGS